MKKLFAVFILASVLVSCKKDDNVALTSPGLNEKISPYQPVFTWKGGESDNYQFTISKSADFSTTVLDTVLSANTFQVPENYKFSPGYSGVLEEKSTYFWRVIQEGKSSSSSFSTNPFLTIFGSHNVEVIHYYGNTLKKYNTTLQIDSVINNKIKVSIPIDGSISETIGFKEVSSNTITYNAGGSANFKFNPITKILFIEFNYSASSTRNTYTINHVVN